MMMPEKAEVIKVLDEELKVPNIKTKKRALKLILDVKKKKKGIR